VTCTATAELTAPTAVGSGDLLGIKVIKLNKINGTPTIGVQIRSPLKTWREPLLQRLKLQSTGSNQNQSNLSLHRRQLPNHQNLRSNPSPKNRRVIDA